MAFGLRRLAQALAYRRLIRSLERLGSAQEQTNVLLARLVDRFAPLPVESVTPPASDPPAGADYARLSSRGSVRGGDITHLDPDELQLAQNFVEAYQQQRGQSPSDEEVVSYLAEQETSRLTYELNQASKGL